MDDVLSCLWDDEEDGALDVSTCLTVVSFACRCRCSDVLDRAAEEVVDATSLGERLRGFIINSIPSTDVDGSNCRSISLDQASLQ